MQALRNVPHLTVTWPNQHALISRRSGLIDRGHQIRDQSVVKQKSGPKPIQGPFPHNYNVASQVGTSMNLLASKAEVIVDSRSSSERLLSPSDPPTTTDGWTVVESASKMDFPEASLTILDVAISERTPPAGAYSSDVLPKTDATQESGDVSFGTNATLSQPPNSLEWTEVASDSLAHSKSDILASSPK